MSKFYAVWKNINSLCLFCFNQFSDLTKTRILSSEAFKEYFVDAKGKVLSIVSLSWEANCGPSNLWQIIFTSIANRCISWALFAIVSKFYNFVSFFPLNQKSVISYKEKKNYPYFYSRCLYMVFCSGNSYGTFNKKN